MTELITAVEAHGIRFPASRHLDGSDAMNPEPDHSAAYVIVRTDGGQEGHAPAFTVGRGNEIAGAAVESPAPLVTADGGAYAEVPSAKPDDSSLWGNTLGG